MHHLKGKGLVPLLLIVLFLSGCARGTAPVNRPFGLERLANENAPYEVQLWSRNNPLVIGQKLGLFMRSMADGYFSMYSISSSEKVYSLLSNIPARTGQTLLFPGALSPYDFRLTPPAGTETYILVSSLKPLYFQIPAPMATPPLAVLPLTPEQFIQRLEDNLRVMNPYEWNTAVLMLPLYPPNY